MIQVIKQEAENGKTETKTVFFKYDPFGRRIEKRVEEVENNETEIKAYTYIYDNEDIILETITETEDGNTKTEVNKYTHGFEIDEPLAVTNSKGTFYYHADGLGSITALTDANQKVVQTYEYDAFGNLKKKGDKVKQPYTYTGREWDKKIGLYYYRARYYDPETGRFISFDPILRGINHTVANLCSQGVNSFPLQSPQDLNFFVYVSDNPINWVDPLGLQKKCQCEVKEYFNWFVFSTCMASKLTGLDLTGPGISALKKFKKKQFYFIAKKFGRKFGSKLLPGIGWSITIIDLANSAAQCKQEATIKCY